MGRGTAAALAAVAVLVAAPGAGAEQRFAAPAGSGSTCKQASPCSLKEAVTKAGNGDEVIVTPGAYTLSEAIYTPSGTKAIHVHGQFGSPMPEISAAISVSVPINIAGSDTRLSYIALENKAEYASGVGCQSGARVDRVLVRTIATKTAYGLIINNTCAVRDSVFVASGNSAIAVLAQGLSGDSTGLARNVTAIADGASSVGIRAAYVPPPPSPGSYTLDLKNAIASGATSDLEVMNTIEGSATILVTNSNFDVIKEMAASKVIGNDNQAAAPKFVDAAGGDYRPAAGSPSIDAGISDQIGTLDLAGSPRTLGAAPDIGAYEFVPPPPPPVPVAAIESLALAPRKFRTVNAGGAIVSAKRKRKAPVGSTVSYALNVAAAVGLRVERGLKGRKVGKKCRKAKSANRKRKRCTRWVKVKGSFSHDGAAGKNRFRFSGRVSGRALRPGRYRLVAEVGASSRRATFRIVH